MSYRRRETALLKPILLMILTVMFLATYPVISQEMPRLEIRVYPDNSIKLMISGTQIVERQAQGYLEAYAEFHENRVKLSLNASFKSPELRDASLRGLGYVHLLTSLVSTVRDRMVIVRGRINLNLTSVEGSIAIRADDIVFSEHLDKMIYNISGRVRIAASGAAVQIIPYIHLLPYMIEPALRQANITYVKVRSITPVPEGKDAVTVSFSIEVDGAQMLQQLGLEAQVLTERRAYPVNLSLILGASSQGIDRLELGIEIGANINVLLGDATRALIMQQLPRPTIYGTTYGVRPTTGVNQEVMDKTLRIVSEVLLNEFTKTFAIMPSDAELKVSTRDSQRLEFYLELPKIVSINARSPEDTLKALHDYIMRVSNRTRELGISVRLEDLLQTYVVLGAEENVRIMLDGNVATNVTFADLPKIRVEVRATATPTTTPTPKPADDITAPQPAEALPTHTTILIAAAVAVVVGTAVALVLVKTRR